MRCNKCYSKSIINNIKPNLKYFYECKKCGNIFEQISRKNKSITTEIRLGVYSRDNFICYRCGKMVIPGGKYKNGDLATIDHFLPRAFGGSEESYNLKTCCSKCNHRKADNIPRVFKLKFPYVLFAALQLNLIKRETVHESHDF